MITRRHILAAPAVLRAQSKAPVVDTHIHLFAADGKAFPFHPAATYKPEPATLETYSTFVKQSDITHGVIVHPEPYQDDHRYLEYCFANEPSKNFFKGTCLFDALDPATPSRIDALLKRWPRRICALRIHRTNPGAPMNSGAIHDRDLAAPQMRRTWKAVADRGLMIQMHFVPAYAAQIQALAKDFPGMNVILDHLGRGGLGTAEQWKDVLALGKLPNTVMKFSGANYSSKQPFPHRDVMPKVREVVDVFGADRIVWGVLGMEAKAYADATAQFNEFFAFTNEANRMKIRGANAIRIYGF